MADDLKLMTWNATGFMSSLYYLCDVLSGKDIDICGLAEHWLYEKDLIFLPYHNRNHGHHKRHALILHQNCSHLPEHWAARARL